jgi:hypothetical protein
VYFIQTGRKTKFVGAGASAKPVKVAKVAVEDPKNPADKTTFKDKIAQKTALKHPENPQKSTDFVPETPLKSENKE